MNKICNTKHLYRYIWKINGKYRVVKYQKSYGTFNTLENALLERDLLEDYNWNTEELINIETVTKNRYQEMNLPPFEKQQKPKEIPKYITKRGNLYLRQKSLNGQTVHFASTKDLNNAIELRNFIKKHNWDKKLLKTIKW